MDLLEIMRVRRSVRKYTKEEIPEESITKILQAGLLSPSGHNKKPWEFVVVKKREMLDVLAKSRVGSAKMLEGATCAIVVFADGSLTDVWAEDCSIAMYGMHLMADALGVGSCWIQGRLRDAENGQTTEEYIKELLGVPEKYRLEAILSLGMCDEHPKGHELEELLWERVHQEQF